MRLRNRSNLVLLSVLMDPSAAFSVDGTYFMVTNSNSIYTLWKCSAVSIYSDLILIDGLWASDMAVELSTRRVIGSRIIGSRSLYTN